MLFVLNKNKIMSYIVTSSVVVILFLFSISIIPSQDAKLVQISSNVLNNNIYDECYNSMNDSNNIHKKQNIIQKTLEK